MLATYIKENRELFNPVINVLNQDHYTYDGDEGLVYDEYPLEEFYWKTGASKVCIPYAGLVFKTSFTGYAYDYDYETSDWLDETIFEPWDKDYCQIEYEIYKRAVKEGVGIFFAETFKLSSKVYAQEECDQIFEDFLEDSDFVPPRSLDGFSPEDITIFANENGILRLKTLMGTTLFRYFLDCYSIASLQKLSNFLIKYDINDLHENNIGWFDGRLKFFDFCGFRSLTFKKIKDD